jgi:hypothetical protein
MKKINLLVAGMVLILLSVVVNGQTKTDADFFTGLWTGIAEGTPAGDMNIAVSLGRIDGMLDGMIKIGEQENVKFSRIEEKETAVTLYFTSNSGYDISLYLEKKDDNHVNGALSTSIAGTFGFTGERALNGENN